MTSEQLKTSILQLAFKGKMLEQIKSEGTGLDFLKSIVLAKSGFSNKKSKPINDDEKPYLIPDNWAWVRLSEIVNIFTGKKDANFGGADGKYMFFTCAKDPIRCNSFSYSGESLLVAGNGDISNISYYDGDFEAYQRTYILQPYIKHTYLKYIMYHMKSNWVRYNTDKMFGSAIPYIRLGNLENYLVALPPLEEQKRIINKLEEILPLIDKYQNYENQLSELNKNIKENLKQSILKIAMEGKLVNQNECDGSGEDLFKQIANEKNIHLCNGEIKKEKLLDKPTENEIPYNIPNTWKWSRCQDLFYVHSAMRIHQSDWKTEGIPFLRGRELVKLAKYGEAELGVFISKEFYNYLKEKGGVPKKNDILISAVGTLGKVYVVKGDRPFYYKDAYVLCLDNYGINPKYIKFFLESPYSQKYIYSYDSHGTTVAQLTLEKLKRMLIPLPPLNEQKRIVLKIEELFKLVDSLPL